MVDKALIFNVSPIIQLSVTNGKNSDTLNAKKPNPTVTAFYVMAFPLRLTVFEMALRSSAPCLNSWSIRNR